MLSRRRLFARACAGARPLGFMPTGFRTFAGAARPFDERGLLHGATDQYYSLKLDLADAKALVEEPGALWKAAEADVAAGGRGASVDDYLQGVDASVRAFLDRNELHGRESITAPLRQLFAGKGQFVLALGGKSVGKSFLFSQADKLLGAEATLKTELLKLAEKKGEAAAALRNDGAEAEAAQLEQEASLLRLQANAVLPRKVVIYDARQHGASLVNGLLEAFDSKAESWTKFLAGNVRIAAAAVAGAADPKAAGEAIRRIMDRVELKVVLGEVIKACEHDKVFLCLVVDEADAALAAEGPEEKKHTIEALRLLTRLTKQEKRVNVFLASSEYAEPYRLTALGNRNDHFTRMVLVPEVPPKEMRELLERKWGMGPNLASAIMAVWGGHVWAVCEGISMLLETKDEFAAIDNLVAFSAGAKDGASQCLVADTGAPEELAAMTPEGRTLTGMRDLLRDIAVTGYAPLESRRDPRAELVGRLNVGGLAIRGTLAPGVPRAAWAGSHESIVVATNQAMRLLLATELRA